MKRLHELTREQLEAWRRERARVGREKYGDAHLNRYGLVDVMEELLDALNIMDLTDCRVGPFGVETSTYYTEMVRLEAALRKAIAAAQAADRALPDIECTDEQGGDRIWWSEHAGSDDDG